MKHKEKQSGTYCPFINSLLKNKQRVNWPVLRIQLCGIEARKWLRKEKQIKAMNGAMCVLARAYITLRASELAHRWTVLNVFCLDVQEHSCSVGRVRLATCGAAV